MNAWKQEVAAAWKRLEKHPEFDLSRIRVDAGDIAELENVVKTWYELCQGKAFCDLKDSAQKQECAKHQKDKLRKREVTVEIIIWEPVSWGGSSFGHVSGSVNGINYSFSPKGMGPRNVDQYIQSNIGFRSGLGFVLNLTEKQATSFQSCLEKQKGEYDIIANNCTNQFKDCLLLDGIDLGNPLFPVDLGRALLKSRKLERIKFYEGPDRSDPFNWENWDAPWAY